MTIPMTRLPAALLLLVACKPDCPEGATDRHGYRCTPLPDETTDTGTTTSDASTTSTADSSSTTLDTSTTQPDPCDDDPACGPGETPDACPEQCTVCGDAIISGSESCDNGPDNQTYFPSTPPTYACTAECTLAVEWCGDASQNGDETCDNGQNQDPPYSQTPLPDACAPGCIVTGYCGDGKKTNDEPCDNGPDNQTYWPTPPPDGSCSLSCSIDLHWCGDATLDPLDGELCDDANNDNGDGCTSDCTSLERLVFVSSKTYFGDLNKDEDNPGNLSGLDLADHRCQTLAQAADLLGTFKAWLSTTNDSPFSRFDTRFQGLYRLSSPDAPVVAMGWQGLSSGTLLVSIKLDESGTSAKGNVWTNTLPDGKRASDTDCSEWTANNNSKTTFGSAISSDAMWTSVDTTQCANALRIYCFEDL